MTPLEIGLAAEAIPVWIIGHYLGWLAGHGRYTPFNWRVLTWLPLYLRWLERKDNA